MSFLDELKKQQNETIGTENAAKQKWTGDIPEELAVQIANNIYVYLTQILSGYIKNKNFESTYDGYRYMVDLSTRYDYLRICGCEIPYRSEVHIRYSITPKNNGYIYLLDEEGSSTFYYGNIKNLKGVLEKAQKRFTDEGLQCVYSYIEKRDRKNKKFHALVFRVWTPCSSEGLLL